MRSFGHSDDEIEAYFTQQGDIQREIHERQRGYAGWLIMHPAFRRSRDNFRQHWGRRFERELKSMRKRLSLFSKRLPPKSEQEESFHVDYWNLCQTWSLNRLARSWEH
jgi:hypothetical protein